MKIQIDINADLWAKFRDKVHGQGKTLASVVPGVLEPALKAYVEPPNCFNPFFQVDQSQMQSIGSPPLIPIKRCELCDMPTDRLYASGMYKTCYSCWKSANKTAQSEAAPSASSSASSPEPLSKPQR